MSGGERHVEQLLAAQLRYYRDIAPEYEEHALTCWDGGELEAALDAFGPAGRVLELACGTGAWTQQLARHAHSVTAIDAAPEMLARAHERVRDERVDFVLADIFRWQPGHSYDVVFFAFWLSHVPPQRFAQFWALVGRCLAPGGSVFFIDDAHRRAEELVDGEAAATVRRRLKDGSSHRIVKVGHTPAELQRLLAELGWQIVVNTAGGHFFWGEGGRAADRFGDPPGYGS